MKVTVEEDGPSGRLPLAPSDSLLSRGCDSYCCGANKWLPGVDMWGSGYRTRLEAVEKRLAELDEAYERVTALEADWQDWLHKIRNVLARLNQRARADELEPQVPRRGINPAAARLLGLNHEGS